MTMRLRSVNIGTARPMRVGSRPVLSAIGKQPVAAAVTVGRLGLAGDEQADLSVHGGLDKAVYAYPAEHLAFWQDRRREHGVSLWDEALAPGFVGENLSLEGLLEPEVWIGDLLLFPDCVLRVTAPREPCYKFNAVAGYAQASRDMVRQNACGFYLAVQQGGTITAGQAFTVEPGRRALPLTEAFQARRVKHLR